MKKIFLLAAVVFLFSCDEIPDGVVDSTLTEIRVVSVSAPNQLQYSGADVQLNVSVQFENTDIISSSWFDIVSENGVSKIKDGISLSQNGNIFSGETTLNDSVAVGKYIIEIYVEDNVEPASNKIHHVASHSFTFSTGQDNIAPVLSNLIMPDNVSFNQQFQFSVDVSDANGLADVRRVYYEVFDPEGTQLVNSQGISKFPLSDNGDTGSTGDAVANDGTYTMVLSIPDNQLEGDWKFEFTAEDQRGLLSNQIIHILTVR